MGKRPTISKHGTPDKPKRGRIIQDWEESDEDSDSEYNKNMSEGKVTSARKLPVVTNPT